jgi:hypothetical protein
MAMKAHAPFLELAATAIDFDLTEAEQAALDAHVASCTACRRAVAALHVDAIDIARLPHRPMSAERAERMAADLRRGRQRNHVVLPSRRWLLLAGLLTLLALGTITLGVGTWLSERSDTDLSVVEPSTVVTEGEPAPSRTPDPTERPPSTPGPASPPPSTGDFVEGAILEVVVAGLRVRTAPTTDSARSSVLQPSLGPAVRMEVLSGPVEADGYTWYEVQAVGWPHRGWVATADQGGEPWIAAAREPPVLPAAQAALADGLRIDARTYCATPATGIWPGASSGIECQVQSSVVTRVLAFGYEDDVAAAGAYRDNLADRGVPRDSGDCANDEPGDAAWAIGDGAAVARIGCFFDENGFAHVRLTCGSTFIQVLGREREIPNVYRAVLGEQTAPEGTPPSLCR